MLTDAQLKKVFASANQPCAPCNNAESELTIKVEITCSCGGDVHWTGEEITVQPGLEVCVCSSCGMVFHVENELRPHLTVSFARFGKVPR